MRAVKMIFEGNLGGKCRVGRQDCNELDGVEKNLKQVGVKRWREKVKNGQDWISILIEARVQLKGL